MALCRLSQLIVRIIDSIPYGRFFLGPIGS